jgi:hypothetical protein
MLGMGGESVNWYQLVIGLGAWLGTIMLFNVWVLIWPNQKKILGIVPAIDEQKATARTTTLYATRANFALSIPLVLCMGSATHGLLRRRAQVRVLGLLEAALPRGRVRLLLKELAITASPRY